MDLNLARKLYKSLALQLDEALQKNLPDKNTVSPLRELDQKVEMMRADGGLLANAKIAEIGNARVRQLFQKCFAITNELAQMIDKTAPLAEQFEMAGYDFAHVTELIESLQLDLTQFALIAAPNGWGLATWEQLFQKLATKSAVLDPKMPLEVASEVAREFVLLDQIDFAGQGQMAVHTKNIAWTLRLIPAGDKPEKMGLNHASGPHLTLPEMLMLQAQKVLRGEEPVDKTTFTWLDGLISDGKLATRHIYDEGQKRIIITSREPGNQGPHMGARPPKS